MKSPNVVRLLALVAVSNCALVFAGNDPITKTGTDRAGFIVTNQHVIAGCSSVSALVDGEEFALQTIEADQANDLAVLRSTKPFTSAIPIRSGDQRLRVGEVVVTLGFPLQGVVATSFTVTTGSIAALAGLGNDTRMIQISAPVQPGSSGGPAVDTSGNLVGVVASKLSPLWAVANVGDIPQNVNFAIRAQVLQAFLDAHGINYETQRSETDKKATEVAESLRPAILPVRCVGSEPGRTGSVANLDGFPVRWKSIMSGNHYTIRMDHHYMYVENQLPDELKTRGDSVTWELRRFADGTYAGTIRPQLVCTQWNGLIGQWDSNRCSTEDVAEFFRVSPVRIEGLTIGPSQGAKFNCNACRYDKSYVKQPFVWIPE